MQNGKSVEQIIGKCIQKIRRAKGYTQQQFAEMMLKNRLKRLLSKLLNIQTKKATKSTIIF